MGAQPRCGHRDAGGTDMGVRGHGNTDAHAYGKAYVSTDVHGCMGREGQTDRWLHAEGEFAPAGHLGAPTLPGSALFPMGQSSVAPTGAPKASLGQGAKHP